MDNKLNNDLTQVLGSTQSIIDLSQGIKNSDFHIYLEKNFGEKAIPFINWAKNTNLDNKITPNKLQKLVLLYEGKIDFNLVSKAVSLDSEVKDEMLNIFENKNIQVSKKEDSVNVSDSIKDENFHIILKEQFGNKAEPFVDWAKKTNLADKITTTKLEKLVLLYEGAIEFDLVAKALSLPLEVKNEMFNIFENQKLNKQIFNQEKKDISEGIKNGDFHIILKEQFGENAKPFIDWAKKTTLEDKITPIKLEKLVLLYEDGVDFNLAVTAIPLDPEVKNEIFNIFEDQKLNSQLLSRKPKI